MKYFAYGQLLASQKYFLIYYMNFDYCQQTKWKNKQKTPPSPPKKKNKKNKKQNKNKQNKNKIQLW